MREQRRLGIRVGLRPTSMAPNDKSLAAPSCADWGASYDAAMRVYVLAFLLLMFACKKKKPEVDHDAAIAKMAEFKDQMCACKDKVCGDKVQEAMTKWSTDMAARSPDKRVNASEAQMKKMTEVGQMYGECMTRAMKPKDEPAPAPSPSPPPPQRTDTPPAPSSWNADDLVRQAREWAAKSKPGRVIATVKYSYVDNSGVLDTTYGAIDIDFGRVDDRDVKRRLGTPVRPKVVHDDCFSMSTTGGAWVVKPRKCGDTRDEVPRCSIPAIWKRAIERNASPEAVAVIELDVLAKQWTFTIDDEPTNLHVREQFPDDCELNVER